MDWHAYCIGLCVSVVLVALICCTSSVQKPPVYHFLFDSVGWFIGLLLWIWLENELVCSLATLRRMMSWGEDTIAGGLMVGVGSGFTGGWN